MTLVVVGRPSPKRVRVTETARALGWDVLSCDSGAEAIELIAAGSPAALVCDSDLPDISGVQLCRLLQSGAAPTTMTLVLVAPESELRTRLLARAACPGTHVVDGVDGELSSILARARQHAPELGQKARTATRGTVLELVSSSLDRALLEAVVAAEVRALGGARSHAEVLSGVAALLDTLFLPAWVGLCVHRPGAPTLLLRSPADSRPNAEQQAREAFGVEPSTACIWQQADAPPGDPCGYCVEAPIFAGTRQCGQLAVGLRSQVGKGDERGLLDLIASELGGPLHIALLLEEMQLAATTDPLTGLINRRAMFDQLRRERARATRHAHSLAVLMIDIDHFKSVNDQHGHGGGDKVLARLAGMFAEVIRSSDLAARWGGEEFLIVLPETGAAGACVVAERLRAAVEAAPFTLGPGVALAVTLSIGVAAASAPFVLDSLIATADRALYDAKRSGRNCVRSGADLAVESGAERVVVSVTNGSET